MVEVRGITRQQLLERESELAEIALALEAASSGQGRLVVMEAAAGLGKTRLLETALAQARERGMTAVAARGTELERDFPYGVVGQLFEPHLAAASEEEREALLEGAAARSRRLFPSVAEGPVPQRPIRPTRPSMGSTG